jgi:hypothetical protein
VVPPPSPDVRGVGNVGDDVGDVSVPTFPSFPLSGSELCWVVPPAVF